MFLLQPLVTVVSIILLFFAFHVQSWKMQAFNQDLAINPIFKCDECSYMAISQTVLKHCSTIKHPNKEEPEALGKLVLEDSLQHFNSPDKKTNI